MQIVEVKVSSTPNEILSTIEALLKEYMENGDLEDLLVSIDNIFKNTSSRKIGLYLTSIFGKFLQCQFTYLFLVLANFQASLDELKLDKIREKIISMAITLALEKHNSQRELASQLISALYGEVYTETHVTKAFDHLLENLNDLTLDTPDAPKVCVCKESLSYLKGN